MLEKPKKAVNDVVSSLAGRGSLVCKGTVLLGKPVIVRKMHPRLYQAVRLPVLVFELSTLGSRETNSGFSWALYLTYLEWYETVFG